MSFRFHFDAGKAIQAIGVLMTHDHASQMNFIRVLKLLYLAEREALKEIARPIIGDSVVATERGPVMENVYSLLRGQHSEFKKFSQHFNTVRYNLVMHLQPDVGELSEYEIETIQRIANQHEDADEWDLVQFARNYLPEWQKNDPGKSSKAIPIEDILVAIGKDDVEIKQIIADELRRRDAATLREFQRLRESPQVSAYSPSACL